MKKILIILSIVLAVANNVQAQETPTENTEVESEGVSNEIIELDIEVDESIFTQISPNTYVSEDPTILLMGMVVPKTFEQLKSESIEDQMPPNFNLSGHGEKTLNGVTVLYLEGTSDTPNGIIECAVLWKERDSKTCLMMMVMGDQGLDQKYVDAIAAAINSVIKITK